MQHWTFLWSPSFKYYIIKLGGVKAFDDLDDTGGGGVQNLGKPDDVILERSLKNEFSCGLIFVGTDPTSTNCEIIYLFPF